MRKTNITLKRWCFRCYIYKIIDREGKELMSKQDISQQLAKLMRENGVSQSGLSRGCGVPQPTINRILNEKTKEPRRESVVRIAKFFGVEPESLYQESDEVREDGDPVARLYAQMSALRPDQRRRLFSKLSEDID